MNPNLPIHGADSSLPSLTIIWQFFSPVIWLLSWRLPNRPPYPLACFAAGPAAHPAGLVHFPIRIKLIHIYPVSSSNQPSEKKHAYVRINQTSVYVCRHSNFLWLWRGGVNFEVWRRLIQWGLLLSPSFDFLKRTLRSFLVFEWYTSNFWDSLQPRIHDRNFAALNRRWFLVVY